MQQTHITEQELLYAMALTQVPNIGPVLARQLLRACGSAQEVFRTKAATLQKIGDIGAIRASCIKQYKDFDLVEKEMQFIKEHNIQVLHMLDSSYPSKLTNCLDAPIVMYYTGTNVLNKQKIISIVGRRKCSDYGRKCVDDLLENLSHFNQELVVISGLAMGIDIHAHRKALQCNIPTVGVLAHGLDTIYPPTHRNTAKQMLQQGGLLTEYISGTVPDRENFPTRNRIVAGISDVTIVVETDVSGGSMITANLANEYNRDVMAYPGDVYNTNSTGCNHLIKTNRAHMITCAQDLIELMNWDVAPVKPKTQRSLFIELNTDEQKIYNYLQQHNGKHIDEVAAATELTPSQLAAATLSLEIQGLVQVLPGKIYKLYD